MRQRTKAVAKGRRQRHPVASFTLGCKGESEAAGILSIDEPFSLWALGTLAPETLISGV